MRLMTLSNSRFLLFLQVVASLSVLLVTERVQGFSGLEGTFEFGADAPWRMEPSKAGDGSTEYGPIPIQVTIHDALYAHLDRTLYAMDVSGFKPVPVQISLPDALLSVGKFHSVRVTELSLDQPQTIEFGINSLYEIEQVIGDWPYPTNPSASPAHELCRVWKGDVTADYVDVSRTSEWHASLWYVPKNKTPGATITLQIDVILQRDPWPAIKLPLSHVEIFKDLSPYITLRNFARVYLAPDPLPRFDNRWLYGDFHYHSQGTDNEGEFGNSYRNTIRALGAMGMDFAFATDHASNSEQFEDVDLNLDLAGKALEKLGDWALGLVVPLRGGDCEESLHESDARYLPGFLRDMDSERYRFCHSLIYAPLGANAEASIHGGNLRFPQNYLSHQVMPQIFLGGEVDAIPEVEASEIGPLSADPSFFPVLRYGNQKSYYLSELTKPSSCEKPYQLFEAAPEGGAYLVHDFQGVDSYQYYGREHMVYFPNSPSLYVGNELSFVPSYTSRYGGATRRLDRTHQVPGGPTREGVLPEIARKGLAFAAHHLNRGSGRGPDGVPWTANRMLLKAFRSPAILGLEFWNEDGRYKSSICSHEFCRDGADGKEYAGKEIGYERAENPDLFGYVPPEVRNVALPLDEFRHGFIGQGNAEGGLFSLQPFDMPYGHWQSSNEDGIRFALHNGAFDWDQLNLLGLDFERNLDLTTPYGGWLLPGEPRRVFMAGGSDAHGELNYHRNGYFLGTEDANDAAIGKPRNLVFAGTPQGALLLSLPPLVKGESVDPTPKTPNLKVNRFPPVIDPGVIITPPVVDPKPPVLDPPVIKPPIVEPPVIEPPVTDPTPKPPRLPPGIIGSILAPPTEVTPPNQPPKRPPIGDVNLGVDIHAHSQEQIIDALRRGRFSVTDGPAIRMAIDLNGNNKIDDTDIQMGDVYHVQKPLPRLGSQKLTLLIEVISTPEFGPISKIDLYVGVHPGTAQRGPNTFPQARVYAPSDHGTRSGADAKGDVFGTFGPFEHRVMADNYFLDSRLHVLPPAGSEYAFTAVTTLDPDTFEAGDGVSPNRLFVRAFAATRADPDPAAEKPARFAFTNPIWILRTEPGLVSGGSGGNTGDTGDAPPQLKYGRNERGRARLTFDGALQFTRSLSEPFQDLPAATSPYEVPMEQPAGFYRARR
jgi:hypothetical protein